MFDRIRSFVSGEDYHGKRLAKVFATHQQTEREKRRERRERARQRKEKAREQKRIDRALRRQRQRDKREARERIRKMESNERAARHIKKRLLKKFRKRYLEKQAELKRRLERERQLKAELKKRREDRWRRRARRDHRWKLAEARRRYLDQQRKNRQEKAEREYFRTFTPLPPQTRAPYVMTADFLPIHVEPLNNEQRKAVQKRMSLRDEKPNKPDPPSPGFQDGTSITELVRRGGSLRNGVPAIDYPWWYYWLVVVPFIIFCPIFIGVLCCWSPEKTDGYLLVKEGASTEEVHRTSTRYKAAILAAIAVLFIAATLGLGLGLFFNYVPGGAPVGTGHDRSVRISGASYTHNAQLEQLSTEIVRELDGDIVWKRSTGGIAACPAPRSCGGDGKNHYGVMYSAFCGYSRYTACVSTRIDQSKATRGSALLHEAMHMYMARLHQHSKGLEILDYRKLQSSYFNEGFTDCLTQVLGGKWMHYGCISGYHMIKAKLCWKSTLHPAILGSLH